MNKSEQAVPVTVPKRKRRTQNRQHLPVLPFVLAGVILIFCLIYNISRGAGTPVTQASAVGAPDQATQAVMSQEDPSAWYLTLVNPWNSIPEGYEVDLAQLDDGHAVDERCYPYLKEMLKACQAEGLSPVVCSSYRSQAKQERLYQNQVKTYKSRGYSSETAKIEAAKAVAIPGTSEHQLGLAVDIVDLGNQNLDKSQENTPVQKWLMENSWRYGFILRYPNEKSETTGIIYEPWHYRYVGKDVAKKLYEQNICLEEYLAQLQA